jgi:hypothetical protein
LNLINELAETQINETDEIRLVFSLPSAAGLYITESVLSLMALMNPTPIWVMGIDASSTHQLETRVGRSPVFYQRWRGADQFEAWRGRSLLNFGTNQISGKRLLSGEDYSWMELELPAMMPRAAELIGSMPLHTVIEKGNVARFGRSHRHPHRRPNLPRHCGSQAGGPGVVNMSDADQGDRHVSNQISGVLATVPWANAATLPCIGAPYWHLG